MARHARIWMVSIVLGLSACASAPPLKPAPLPSDAGERRTSIAALGRALFAAMRDSAPQRVLAAPADLDELLEPEGRLRVERERDLREGYGQTAWHDLWARSEFVGFCAQGAREEQAGAALGLKAEAWVLDRLLVVASTGARRSASWVEGRFVYTDQGWKALSFTRLEPPRVHHADLELAPCDVEQGIR